ncbi:MAG: hypothetical protein HYU67_01005 [Flavobacteriia bacterium]|nr:hypothetical protein [Flavobacteriia bacterium]
MKEGMKNLILVIIITIGLPFVFFGQNNEEGATFDFNKKIRYDRKGQFYFNPYYGFPHLEKIFIDYYFKSDSTIKSYNFEKIKTKGIGPLGFRAGYFLNKYISLGIDFYYNQYYVDLTDEYEVFDFELQQNVIQTDVYRYIMTRYRGLISGNFYFPTSKSNFDLYGGLGIGFNIRKFDFKENNVSVVEFQEEVENSTSVLPIAMRMNFGMRYYFTKNIGFNAEVGIGGALLSAGLMIRFNAK